MIIRIFMDFEKEAIKIIRKYAQLSAQGICNAADVLHFLDIVNS